MNKEILKSIANTCHRAALIREDSWNEELIKYTIHLENACEQACKEYGLPQELSKLIYLAMEENWNDVLEWADSIKN